MSHGQIQTSQILRCFVVADLARRRSCQSRTTPSTRNFRHLRIIAPGNTISHMWINPTATNKVHLRTLRSEKRRASFASESLLSEIIHVRGPTSVRPRWTVKHQGLDQEVSPDSLLCGTDPDLSPLDTFFVSSCLLLWSTSRFLPKLAHCRVYLTIIAGNFTDIIITFISLILMSP